MGFSTVPVRNNGDKVDASWWNLLRTAGLAIETFLGGGFISETLFTLANNQVAAANVTGLLFAAASYSSVVIEFEIRRKTNSNEAVCSGDFRLLYRENSATWDIVPPLVNGDDPGVTFSVTAGGQVQYVSDSMAGTGYVGKLKFKAKTFTT